MVQIFTERFLDQLQAKMEKTSLIEYIMYTQPCSFEKAVLILCEIYNIEPEYFCAKSTHLERLVNEIINEQTHNISAILVRNFFNRVLLRKEPCCAKQFIKKFRKLM